ncbi:hypothetical protein Amn_36830 [Aminobacter sp. Y103A]|uniref:hypothetical protein n=1 Tax=Aminobacter sp. Y103A TaxID=1870862 RepID=UPI00257429F1|nr:hypothetical protein [Aminobacter sp. SS-2016]BBD38803.1 hypothetical protein Amn_36830 [Aminobacter sp. SS-2016]
MGARDDIDLLTTSCDLLLPLIDEKEHQAIEALSESGSTVAVNSLRALRVQRTVISVGMFSAYEAVLQDEFGFGDYAFQDLEKLLMKLGRKDVVEVFVNYKLAINVLKHGKGKSYDQLLSRHSMLDFDVRGDGSDFDEEGDVTDGQFLVRVDSHFVRRCAEVIEQSLEVARD